MNRLKELREESSLTQQELAKKIGVHYRTIQNWENEQIQIKPDKAKKLADYFEVNLGYIYGYSKIPNEDYIIELQEVLHREYELKLENARLCSEINFLTDENERLTRELDEEQTIKFEFEKELFNHG